MVENYQTHFFVAFETYKEEAGVRLDEDRLKPGEKVSRKDGKIEIEGMVSVMEVNGLLARVIFDKNPAREFYIEETTTMKRAAEMAYKQLLALAPDESEHVRRCAKLFITLKRPDDARRIIETGLRLNPRSKRLTEMLDEVANAELRIPNSK